MAFVRDRVSAGGVTFEYLEAGPADGPLALCVHGFPDTPVTFRHLLPDLAAAGYHAVAPWTRGYAPTDVPADGQYHLAALGEDLNNLRAALSCAGGSGRDARAAVVIGHDWGGLAAYEAVRSDPNAWGRAVMLAVPPAEATDRRFLSFGYLRRMWHMYFFTVPGSELAVRMSRFKFLEELWADWSPGYPAALELEWVREAFRRPENLQAALGYYRALHENAPRPPSRDRVFRDGPPVLYLHGAGDGCVPADITAAVPDILPPGSASGVVEQSGHFLHLEHPALVNAWILRFLADGC